jgi:O-antigen/teichoic acid export membrane protein
MSIFRSAVWDFTGKIVNQLIAFLVSMILARLLTPNEFGIMGIALAFVGFSNIFLDLGFKNAVIIHQQKADELYSSILWVNVFVALVLSVIFFVSAPAIAKFYKEEQVASVIRWAVLMFLINAFTLMPNALNIKSLRFRELAYISIFSAFVSGGIAIWMAYAGFGIWSILARSVINGLLTCILNWLLCKWLPLLKVSFAQLKTIWGYSTRLFATTLMEIVVQKIDVLIMARVYNTMTVGYYTRAQSLDNISRELTSGSMYSVFFPYFGRIQNDPEKIKTLYLKCLNIVTCVLVLLTGGLYLNARDIFVLLFTEKWLPSVPFFNILTITGYFLTINVIMNILVAGIGRSKEYLRAEIVKKVIIIVSFVIGFMGDVEHFLVAVLISSILGLLVMAYTVRMVSNISILLQLRVIALYLGLGIGCVLLVSLVQPYIALNKFWRIVIIGGLYMGIFIALNYLIKTSAYTLASGIVRSLIRKEKVELV